MSKHDSLAGLMDVAPTAYGLHLRHLLERAIQLQPHLFSHGERRMVDALGAVAEPELDIVSRCLQRVAPLQSTPQAVVDEASRRLLVLTGWITTEDGLAMQARAVQLVHVALAAMTHSPEADLSLPVRLRMSGRLLPSYPIAGTETPLFVDRKHVHAWLEAVAHLGQPSNESGLIRALSETARYTGDCVPLLAYHLYPGYVWARRLWHCLPPVNQPAARMSALRILRDAPGGPSLARHLAEEIWRSSPVAMGRRRVAAMVASWSLWSPGERQRWELRAKAQRRPSAISGLPKRTITAWLEHDQAGSVVADGERVESCALRQLQREGWQGVHAEGGFWLGLIMRLAWPVITAEVPMVWSGAWQCLPVDWARWGFSARRHEEIDAVCQALKQDRVRIFDERMAELAELQLPGVPDIPDLAFTRAVVAAMPALALIRMLRLLLHQPRASAGLPDLVCVRNGELVLWEVKSPSDSISDKQRAWLHWFALEHISAGVIHIQHRHHQQTSLLAGPTQRSTAAEKLEVVTAQKKQRATRRQIKVQAWEFLLLNGRVLAPAAGAVVGDELVWGHEVQLPSSAWNGRVGSAAVEAWLRPVEAVLGLDIFACRPHGWQQWLAVPSGYQLPLLISEEASPDGGTRRCATFLTHRSGWLVESDRVRREPVVAPSTACHALATGECEAVDWTAHPQQVPFRPHILAAAWGCADELQQQIDLVAHDDFALAAIGEEEGIAILTRSAPLWICSHPRLHQRLLPRA